ncbi:hypothetical protein B0H63DRAFT_483649 [Podospora didyma]|uniref:Uncharacterized protein n=1 Tax=Podospora didyma TaxID=330526 RepID=A0AAE0K9J3_9PEZI|nr:hypothetical protein B0H63DRAFT_483649 [Podospora didyma]
MALFFLGTLPSSTTLSVRRRGDINRSTMGSKRDATSLELNDYEESVPLASNKRRRELAKSKRPEPKTDATSGQRCAFPSLEESMSLSDDDLEWEDKTDVFAYLTSVRQEASGIPRLLVAPKVGPQLPPHLQSANALDSTGDGIDRGIYDNGVGDSRGFYDDGAYIAAPDTESTASSPTNDGFEVEEGELDDNLRLHQIRIPAVAQRRLREAYYAAIVSRFEVLRSRLHQEPDDGLVAALPSEHGTFAGSLGPNSWTFKVWNHRVSNTDPWLVQIAAMRPLSVFRVLRVILAGKFIRPESQLRERTSRWLWALLARLPHRGELAFDDISRIRELGKRAVSMLTDRANLEALRKQVGNDEVDGEVLDDGDDNFILTETEVPNVGDFITPVLAVESVAPLEEPPVAEATQPANGLSTPARPQSPDHPTPHADDNEADNDGEMDMDLDDGELIDEPIAAITSLTPQDEEAELEAARARLLFALGNPQCDAPETPPQEVEDAQSEPGSVVDEERAQINMRATMNMILTVIGELYGQRDLLEFRDPFPVL